tara:strand:- start:99 stop:452 length:354 start_codon:yes stop_codon:yes gene_type:complete
MKRKENKMKHTQGKWGVEKNIGLYSIKIGDKYIAGVHGQERKIEDDSKALGYRYDNSETIANANLIASSPDMLDGMRTILQKLEKFRTLDRGSLIRGHILDNIQRITEENIAKAEGK